MKRGQTLVEFALVSMIMLFVVLGLVDFGFLFAGVVGFVGQVCHHLRQGIEGEELDARCSPTGGAVGAAD